MGSFVAAVALICSVALPHGTCIVSNAEQAYYANVPKAFCVPAMQQLVAERTRARPLNLGQEYIEILCKNETHGGGLTADDVGQVAPEQQHTFTAEEVRRLTAR
jgi:hypothetical protein